MLRKILTVLIISLFLISCDTIKNLSELSQDEMIKKLSTATIEDVTDVSYVTDAGEKKTTLTIKPDYTFEYTYEKTYKGSRNSFVYVTGEIKFIGDVEDVTDRGTSMLMQKLELLGRNSDSKPVEFNASIIQFKNSSGFKNELLFSGESKTYDTSETSSSDNLKLPSKNISL